MPEIAGSSQFQKSSCCRTLLSQTAKMRAWHLSESLRKGKKYYAAVVRKKSKKNVRETAL